jgi:formate dehydrogenase major subunit
MAKREKEAGRFELSRRDFLKVSAAGAAAVAALDFAPAPAMAFGPNDLMPGDTDVVKFHTTCPYCSASCGQVVVVGNGTAGNVYDIYGDPDSPINNGGLCAKGAGAYQLVTNKRRLGAFAGPHPVNPKFAYDATPTYADGVAYKRIGNGDWNKMALATAMDEIADGDAAGDNSHLGLVAYRGDITPGLSCASNAKSVQFFGCSHMNNEQNYTYRKLIAQFGTSMTEHQARI